MKCVVEFFSEKPGLAVKNRNRLQRWSIQGSKIPMLSLGLLVYLAACATSQSVQFSSESPAQRVTVVGDLYRPEGNGPFPAVIVLHTCGGVTPRDHSFASSLRDEGYIALVLDSFSPRGNTGRGYRCRSGNFDNHVNDSTYDALGAVAYLRSLPFVRGDRIGIIGFSLGATSALSLPPESSERGIQAAVSYYPVCETPGGRHFFKDSKVPLLLLLGELDNWSPTSQCVKKGEDLRKSGRAVEWTVYARAHHGFDNTTYIQSRTDERNRTMQYDQNAAADSWKRVLAFLNQHLRTG